MVIPSPSPFKSEYMCIVKHVVFPNEKNAFRHHVSFRFYLDELKVSELPYRVVWQVDIPPSIQLAHTSPIEHRLRAVQTAATRGRSVDCKGGYDIKHVSFNKDRKMVEECQSNHERSQGFRCSCMAVKRLRSVHITPCYI